MRSAHATRVSPGRWRRETASLAGHAFTQCTSEVQAALGAAPVLQLQKLQVLAAGNQLQLSGVTISDFAHWHWTPMGKLVLRPTTLAALQPLICTAIPVQAGVEGVVDFTGTPRIRTAHCCCAIPVLRSDPGPSNSIARSSPLPSMLTWSIIEKETTLRYHGTTISVTGTMPFDQHTLSPLGIRLQQVKAEELNLDDFTALVPCDDPHAGQFTQDARLRLPIDIAGHFSLSGSLTASLLPGHGETIGEMVANTHACAGRAEWREECQRGRCPVPASECDAGISRRDAHAHPDAIRISPARRRKQGIVLHWAKPGKPNSAAWIC